MEKKYIVTVNLKDGLKIVKQKDYEWGIESALNDSNKQFIDICGNTFNKNEITAVIIKENPLYKEETEENVNE